MAQNTFALMTNLGRAKEAAALANGTSVVITHIAIGDGTTVPSGGETALYHEVARKAISGHGTVVGASNVAYFDIFLEAAEGPYTIREAGLIDQDGDLIAIARYDPPISKPIPSSGQTVEGTIRLEIAFSNIAAITIVVDPAFKVALQRLSRLPWLPVISMSVSAPPAAPSIGDVYYVPADATGAWNGQTGKIAEYTSAGWAILTPPEGHGISLPDGRIFERVSGSYVEKVALDAQSGKWSFAICGGATDALTGTLDPAPQQLYDGMEIHILPSVTPAPGATLNINGLGAKAIRGPDGAAIRKGDMVSGTIAELVYSSAVGGWVLLSGPRISSQIKGFKVMGLNSATLPSGVTTSVLFKQKAFDTDNAYSLATGIYTVPMAGVYLISTNYWFADIPESTYLFIMKNGQAIAETSANTRGRVISASTAEKCEAGDRLAINVQQLSGATMTLQITLNYPFVFSAAYLGSV